MNKTSLLSVRVLGVMFAVAVTALPQSYTISAKPGAINYIEGEVSIDGQPVGASSLRSTFLNAGSLLETNDGKAEVLLTPGVFLRVGDHSRVRMLKPSLIETELAVEAGESMIEADQFVKDSHITISMRGGITEIEKTGLYRLNADGAPSVGVIEGKAQVSFGEKHTNLGKGKEVLLSDSLKTQPIDKDRSDELFAWSNIRSQYNASLTYQAAKSAYSSGAGFGGGYDAGYYGQGWFWSNGFNSWLWMPGGAFYSPFGWGFYGPSYVYGAPVVYVPVTGGGGGVIATGGKPVKPPIHPLPPGTPLRPVYNTANKGGMMVPVDARHLPAVGFNASSPAGFEAARAHMNRTIQSTGGLRTGSGVPVQRGGGFGNNGGFGGGRGYSGSNGNSSARSTGGGARTSGGGGSFGGGARTSGGGGMSAGGGGGRAGGGGMSSAGGGGGAKSK
jgi:hypothetical protein